MWLLPAIYKHEQDALRIQNVVVLVDSCCSHWKVPSMTTSVPLTKLLRSCLCLHTKFLCTGC